MTISPSKKFILYCDLVHTLFLSYDWNAHFTENIYLYYMIYTLIFFYSDIFLLKFVPFFFFKAYCNLACPRLESTVLHEACHAKFFLLVSFSFFLFLFLPPFMKNVKCVIDPISFFGLAVRKFKAKLAWPSILYMVDICHTRWCLNFPWLLTIQLYFSWP